MSSLTALLITAMIVGQSANPALDLAAKAERVDSGWGDYAARAQMEIYDKQGTLRFSRQFTTQSLEVAGDGDLSLALFIQPSAVAGSFFVVHGHAERDDDTWVYLSASRRLRAIGGDTQTSSWFNSHLTNEDVAYLAVVEYGYSMLADSVQYAGQACAVIIRTPKDKNSGYSHQHVWIDLEHYRVWRIDCFTAKSGAQVFKTIEFKDYQQYATPNGKFWRASAVLVTMGPGSKEPGAKTVIAWSDHSFSQGLTKQNFDAAALASRPN